MSFNFLTLADALKAQADKAKLMVDMGWNKITKNSDSGADTPVATEVKPVDSGVIKARAPRKTK